VKECWHWLFSRWPLQIRRQGYEPMAPICETSPASDGGQQSNSSRSSRLTRNLARISWRDCPAGDI